MNYTTLKSAIRKFLKDSILYRVVWYFRIKNQVHKGKKLVKEWERLNKPLPPPPLIKWRVVAEYGKKFSLDTLIETGTCRGDTLWFNKNNFKKIMSIELGRMFYERAKIMFSPFKHISIFSGDSSKILPEILRKLNTRALFWLDAHYSGGSTARGELYTPIIKELECIFRHPVYGHVILIDDARLFTGTDDYPTLDFLQKFVYKNCPNASIEIENDIIRIYRKHTQTKS